VLRPRTPRATEPARALGLAFQLTNFLRDVGEDLDRGRVYLPQEDLARHGADPHLRTVTPAWRAMMAEQIARNRELYRQAAPGVGMLPGPAARCVATALRMYALILRRIEAADYDVFPVRHRVPRRTKVAIVADVLARGPSHRLTPPR
jgi:15-cis-phytoene synthase